MTMSGNQLTSLFLYVTGDKFWLSTALAFLYAGFGQSVSRYFNNMDKEAIKKKSERLHHQVEGMWIVLCIIFLECYYIEMT